MNKNPEKKFGILFFFVFVIIAFYPLLSSGEIKLLFLIPALIFLVLAFIKPILLRPLNFAWIKLGEILGKVIAPMVMFFLFFFYCYADRSFSSIVWKRSFENKILKRQLLLD